MGKYRNIELTEKDKERFRTKFICGDPDECWEWQGSRNPNGYGTFMLNGYSTIATRVSFVAYNDGCSIDDLCVLHRCDNPGCVNPNHLFLGTVADNARDAMLKGRLSWREERYFVQAHGELHHNTKLTDEDVSYIRDNFHDFRTSDLASKFGVCVQTITNIARGNTWKLNPYPVCDKKSRILTSGDAEEIREKRANGSIASDLAAEYGVKSATVNAIVRGDIWKGAGGRIEKRKPNSSITRDIAISIRERYASGDCIRQIAFDYGITVSNAYNIVRGRRWLDSGGPISYAPKRSRGD